MPPLPDNTHQPPLYPTALENNPCSRSISDDGLCAWCSHLLYRLGECSLCSLSITEGSWPSRCDEDGYAQSCPSLCLNNSPETSKEIK